MTTDKRPIGIVPLGKVPGLPLKIIAAHISGFFNLNAQVLPQLEQPDYAFDENRGQYNAGGILKTLASESFGDYNKIVGVLNLDIFVPIFSHVYGEARQGGKYALVSLYRLGQPQDNPSSSDPALYERTSKVALHELGHLFDLYHCEQQQCLMHFSGGLDDLDTIPLSLCRYCSTTLKYNLSR